MKRYIIISVMLIFVLGLNAQRTNTDSRSAAKTTSNSKSTEDDKKVSPAKTETRTPDASPTRHNSATESKREAPARTSPDERKAEPAYNESRNRETPPVREIASPRQAESTRTETPSTQGVSRNNETTGKSSTPTRVNQEPERNARGSNPASRESGQRVSGTSRPEYRNSGNSRETNVQGSREYTPRTEKEYVERRQVYRTPERPRTARVVNHSTNYVHHPVEYRRIHYPYSEPQRAEIIWDVHMYNEYRYIYPHYDYWYYPYGYRIHTVSAYDADRYIGEIARIFGRVTDVWYERQTDEFTLYFGEPYPYQDFSVIISGKQARRYSRHPERYFIDRNVAVTGLLSLWEERPEMVIRKRSQIEIYF